ncbi:MAG: ABC transporter ATP-binding protein [Firmicutes bacterium]|nr:ABC transporter ATP-binding protein [Bacillota bacterium]
MDKKISVENLHFSYTEEEEVLKGISLEFDHRSTAIIGQNGAGKTTFVKLLKGILKPKIGDIIINGKNTREATVAELAGEIGLVFQNPNDQIFKGKVIDEVMFGPLNIGQDEDIARDNALKALNMLDIADKQEINPYDLTLSDRKLVTIASILAMDTAIIILDEPTIAQDYAGKEKIKGLIKDLSNQGKLVLTIIHDMDFVAETFERTVVFNEGRVLLDSNTRDVYSQEAVLKDAYLEPPHVTQLCHKLGAQNTFLTVEEFLEYKKAKSR